MNAFFFGKIIINLTFYLLSWLITSLFLFPWNVRQVLMAMMISFSISYHDRFLPIHKYIFDREQHNETEFKKATISHTFWAYFLNRKFYYFDTNLTAVCCSLGMMTPSNGSIVRVTGHLCGEFTGHRWIPSTKASDAELWCFLWSAPEWTVE